MLCRYSEPEWHITLTCALCGEKVEMSESQCGGNRPARDCRYLCDFCQDEQDTQQADKENEETL